jgi:nucleoid DNA-binding protein
MEKELIKLVAQMTGESYFTVSQTINHYEQYIDQTIESGRLENVRIPLLGIFKVNLKKLKYETYGKSSPKTKVVKPQKPTT